MEPVMDSLPTLAFVGSVIVLPAGAWAIRRVILHDQMIAVQDTKLDQIQHSLNIIMNHLRSKQRGDHDQFI